MRKYGLLLLAASMFLIVVFAGCGGGGGGGGSSAFSSVSGTISDINRNTITGAKVWTDNAPSNVTESLASGAYRLDGVASGWRTIRARTVVNGETWIGSTAVEVLKNEPTMNINIVLSPVTDITEIGGVVKDDTGHPIKGARVLFTTRIVYPPDATSSDDGAFGSIVAITDSDGRYLLEDVPVGVSGIAAASKVGFRNNEVTIDTVESGHVINFSLIPTNGTLTPNAPTLEAIESYTMPDTVNFSTAGTSQIAAYRAIKTYISPRYKDAIEGKSTKVVTQSTPQGSLIEADLYWNAFTDNDSRDIAGYGIYRTTSPALEELAIDFIRDPYANFYGDMGTELTPYKNYYYSVTAVDVEFLNSNNNPVEGAESDHSNSLSVKPLGQLIVTSPSISDTVSLNPTFKWRSLSGADNYRIVVFDRFPVLPFTPVIDLNASDGSTSLTYNGSALENSKTYYWIILASDASGKAFSYSEIRRFTVNQ